MSTTEQSSHVTLSIPSEQPPPSDNFQFMSDAFTLPQDGQTNPTQGSHSQGYAAGLYLLLKLISKISCCFFFDF